MSSAVGIAGRLLLAPGGAQPALVRERPPGLARLLRDRPADSWPTLAAALFTLCGHAHRATAARAVAAARGLVGAVGQQDALALRWHTARDHVRRMLIDWEPQPGPPRAAAAHALGCCPLVRDSDRAEGLRALPQWLHTHLLGMPAQEWLDAWETGGEPWLLCWSASAPGPAAAYLRLQASAARAIALPSRGLSLRAGTAAVETLAASLSTAQDADAAIALLAAQGHDTGAWNRARDAGGPGGHNAWMRLASRLADLARLACQADWLDGGAQPTGAGEGMAWCETARGLLAHWVRLDGDRLVRCHVLSPTDWNFHPQGVAAQALPALDGAQALVLATALDPCVPASLAAREELAHA